MRKCSFCGADSVEMRVGSLQLCGCCLSELCRVETHDLRYGWFLEAVKRAGFAGAIAFPKKASPRTPLGKSFAGIIYKGVY